MANVTVNAGHAGLGVRSEGLVARLQRRLADHRTYRRTLDELRALSDRELNDLGISRLTIRQVAYDSVYGR